MSPLDSLELMSRRHALEIFRGPLPPQRSARKDDCLSASARVSSLQEARRCRVEKYPACAGNMMFKAVQGGGFVRQIEG